MESGTAKTKQVMKMIDDGESIYQFSSNNGNFPADQISDSISDNMNEAVG